MGVPKFFRYISERYPCLSEIIKEYQIPTFDNLYLDMNGIIHMCSHPDDGDAHFRITEEKIFEDIFHYIEVLFRMIKPQKLFFMAVDGVAPRAKMNQQRGRRFRTAKETMVLENKARERGEELPEEERFDSNCITPGTEFMVRLHEQLKYFVVNRVSSNQLWRDCKIILSGHETPGEGEHKIMDYIRYIRSQPGYDPNTRHCLYGLDADLIMLGLCTHEPHFSLLREEVRFGKKSNKCKNIPEQINFYLLHLSLLREYLELEFYPLKESLSFEYDMEKIIDDWVLMGFLVGNDFIPNLPNIHIASGALPILYNAYMKVLPKLGGYINESGILNLKRFETFILELSSLDIDNFTEKYADLKWFEGKTGRRMDGRDLEEWKCEDNNIVCDEPLESTSQNTQLSDLIKRTESLLDDCKEDGVGENEEDLFMVEFVQHKTDYYINKLGFESVTPKVLQSQSEEYVRAIQWNLHYYYHGVCSWSWYYPHHYAPYVSDIKGFTESNFIYDLGTPFNPYEQLLAVLPSASKTLLPVPFQELMVNEDSPIKDFYPADFKTDLNGKRQEWEAVVLIPFIDEKRLLKAMAECSHRLSQEETHRNCHGPMLIYQHTSKNLGEYPAPGYFLPVYESHAQCTKMTNEDINIPKNEIINGPYPGANFSTYYPGFPTLKHLKYKGTLEKWNVKVFDQPSRGENMILHVLDDSEELPTADAIAGELLGKSVYVGWPYLVEALVVSVATEEYHYKSAGTEGQYNVEESKGKQADFWKRESDGISDYYRNRFGINVGDTKVLLHVKTMVGRKYVFSQNATQITFEKQWAKVTSVYPMQTVVSRIPVFEEKYTVYKDIESIFPVGSMCFMLGQPGYGLLGEVMHSKEALQNGRIKLNFKASEEPDMQPIIKKDRDISLRFMNLHIASMKLSISRSLFSRITGSVLVSPGEKSSLQFSDTPKVNIGLNLKFNKKNEEIPGYSRKEGNMWLYSEKAVELVKAYINKYPEVAEFLNARSGDDVYYEEDIFPNGNSKALLSDITTWIKKQPFYSIERLVCGSTMADPEAVKELECVIENFTQKNPNFKSKIMQVKPHLLYKPGLQIGNLMPDPFAQFFLFDRIVNIRHGFSVPFGLKGTVIGIHNANSGKEEEVMFDVLFDSQFPGGLSINGSSPYRVYRMSKPSILNISHGMRAYQEKINNGKVPSQKLPNQNNSAFPQYSITRQPNVPQPTYPMLQNGNAHIQPPGYNPFYNQLPQLNYPAFMSHGPNTPPFITHAPNTPPFISHPPNTPPFISHGPNTFVPYKGDNFPLVPPPHMVPSPMTYLQGPPILRTQSIFNHQVYSNGNILHEKSVDQCGAASPNMQQQKGTPLPNDSEYLKRLLKINENNMNTSNNAAPKVDDGSSYYTVQLLKEFQQRNLGCPSYQLFNVKDKFTAKLTMPDGKYVFGVPANNTDLASENAAKEALNFFRIKDIPQKREIVPTNIAHPRPANVNDSPRVKPSPEAMKSTIFKYLDINPVKMGTNTGFVPPQVMRNQNVVNNAVIDSTIPRESNLQEPLKPVITREIPRNSVKPKKKRERTMRIAANFSK